MKTILVTISFLLLVAEVAHAAATCTPKNNPNSPMIETEIQNPEATLDFDNLIDLELTPNITLAETVITIRGSPECGLNTNFALGIGVWKNGFAWNPVDPESAGPGSFLGLNSLPGKNEYCEIIFSDPISRFSMRVASDKGAEAGMFIYDESDQEIDCNLFPWVTNSSDNAYAVRGYSSLSRIIKRILFKDSFFAADLLKFSRCPEGTKLEGSLCKGKILPTLHHNILTIGSYLRFPNLRSECGLRDRQRSCDLHLLGLLYWQRDYRLHSY